MDKIIEENKFIARIKIEIDITFINFSITQERVARDDNKTVWKTRINKKNFVNFIQPHIPWAWGSPEKEDWKNNKPKEQG